jgi:hypothetical protein
MIIIITIRSAHIGFEEAGIDDDTSVKNLAYESKIVIARPTRSPDLAWAMPKYFICLSSVKDQAVLSYFYPHSDWTLLEYSTAAEDQGSNVDFYSFKIKIKRRALYYGVMVIAPTVLFALLNPLA